MTIFEKVMRVRRRVIFRHELGYYGHVWLNSRKAIVINLMLNERRIPSRTYFHECLHIVFPDLSEREIRTIEEAEWNIMTANERFLLARKLYNRKWKVR